MRTVRQSRLKSLRAKSYPGSDDEWAQIVSYVFGQSEPSNRETDWSSGVEASATISGPEDDEDNHEMTITIRKRVETITVCMRTHLSTATVLTYTTAKTWHSYS